MMREPGLAPASIKALASAQGPMAARAAIQQAGSAQKLSATESGGNQFFLSLLGRTAVQPKLRASPSVQRKCAKCEEEDEEETIRRAQGRGGDGFDEEMTETVVERESATTEMPGETPTETVTESLDETTAETPVEAPEAPVSEAESPAADTTASALLVEDDAEEVGPAQMKKTEFLDVLRSAVCRAVDAGLSGNGLNSDGCPHVEYWFERAAGKSVSFIERIIQRFAPEAQGAKAATDYIPAVASRVLQSTQVWATTGRIEGVPEDVLSVVSGPGEGEAGGQAIPRIQFKARAGGSNAPDDVVAVRDELGSGRPLDGGVRGRMESAYGVSFGQVRIHTDGTAARLSDRFNARAFTVGEHVAFASNQYRPGTLAGDGLIAHELAHVVQQASQRSASPSAPVVNDAPLERDADASAGAAMLALVGGSARSVGRLAGQVLPILRSGLALQRCSKTASPPTLSRRVTVQPVDKGCGGMEMAAIFSVDNATSTTNGFIVQKLSFDLSRESCAGVRNDFQKTYWEAWQVRNGIAYIGTSASRHDSDGRGDHFFINSTPSHKGTNKEHGWAKYIDGYTEPNNWGSCPEAGSLPCTTTAPAGWTDAGTIHRYIETDFDCCSNAGTTRFDKQA